MRRLPVTATIRTAALAAGVCVLGFQQIGSAQPKPSHEPFANSVAQQAEMIQLLKEINLQLKEQNNLLKNGVLRVAVDRGGAAAPAGVGILKKK